MSYNNNTKMYDGYIYKITNISNGCSYIGQTIREVDMRVREHFISTNKDGANKFFINKDDFVFDTIECISCETLDELCGLFDEREIYWIKYYDTYYNGYNCNLGGQRERNVHDGLQILAYNKQGEFIGKYRTMTEAGLATGANRNDVSKSCYSIDKYLFGNNYLFRFESNPLSKKQIEELKLKYPLIFQYSIDGKLINTFNSCADAALYLRENYKCNTQSRDISSKCNKDNRTLLGFVWRKYPYLYEDFLVPKKKRIEQRNIITGDLLNIFDTCMSAADATGGNATCIGQIANKKKGFLTSAGYFWCYEGEFDEEYFKKACNHYNAFTNQI